MGDSNSRPDGPKPPALPTALIPDFGLLSLLSFCARCGQTCGQTVFLTISACGGSAFIVGVSRDCGHGIFRLEGGATRSQTRRDTNFAIPGYSISAMIPRRGVKIKFFLSVVIPVVKAAFVPFSATGGNPANAGVARLCGVSPHPIPDTATALPKTRRDTNFAIPGYPRAALSRRPLIVPYFPPGRKVEAKLFSIQASHLREKPRLRPPPPPGGRP